MKNIGAQRNMKEPITSCKAPSGKFLSVILELGAVFFLVQSILTVFPEGKSNWYLPLALGLNCIALFLNGVQQRKQKRTDGQKE